MPQESVSLGDAQFRNWASANAVEVLPMPRVPWKSTAWGRRPRATARRRKAWASSWPRMSEKRGMAGAL